MMKISEKELTRRGFITRVGQGLVATGVTAPLLKNAHAQLRVPDPPGKKLGWAIVGLGSLAINQILPAFAKCEKSKVVAFVSGHPDKANKLADIGIYALNAARYLTGEEPTEVNAMSFTDRNDPRFKEVESNVIFQLRFPSGIIANCSSSYSYFHQSHYRVMGTEARLEMDPATWYNGNRLWIERGNKIEQIELQEADHFALEMDHMSDCVMQNKEPLTPGEEGLRDLTIIEAVYEAAKSGKTVKLA
jgi:predicted dehydrogenase